MIDLDKKRAARREAKGAGPEVKLGGKTYELPSELPFAVIEALDELQGENPAASAMIDLTKAILGTHYADILAAGLTTDDITELIGDLMKEYGLEDPLPSTAS